MSDPDAKRPAQPAADIAPETTVRPSPGAPSPSASIEATRLSGERLGAVLPRGTAIGRYFLLQLLGEGGMGTVYAAYDPDLGRKVAIKLLKVSSEGQGAEEARARLLREAQAMARLSHPNVLPVFDAGMFGAQLFVAMEYVPGATLAAWLQERPRPVAEILGAFLDAGQGLAAAHAAGLVHRDFKPENVLVGKDGRVRVMDFGLAHVEAAEETSAVGRPRLTGGVQSTLSGQVAGTPAYMAPEQFSLAPTDERTDQFSFCVALWEALCGERPFAGLDFGTIRHHVLQGSVRAPPRSARLDGAVREALLRGLSRDPADRFASMRELLALLLRRQNRSRVLRRVAGWVTAALVLLAATGLAAWRSYREATGCEREASAASLEQWSPPRRAAVEANLLAAGVGRGAVDDAVAQLEQHFAAWTSARRAACEQARHLQQPDARALWCLERLRLRANSVVGLLGKPAPDLRGSVVALLDSLDQPGACLGGSRLSLAQDSPRLSELRAALQELRALLPMGRYADVLGRAPALVDQARALGALPELAEAEILLSWSRWRGDGGAVGDLALARQAVRDADASGDDGLSLEARLDLAMLCMLSLDRYDDAEAALLDAEAWQRRLGDPFHSALRLALARADLAGLRGQVEESAQLYRRALSVAQAAPARDQARSTGYVHNNLGTLFAQEGRFAESGAELEAAFELYSRSNLVSAADLALTTTNLAVVRLHQHRLDDALALVERSDRLLAPLRSQETFFTLWNDSIRGMVLEARGEHAAAAAVLEKVLAQEASLDNIGRAEAKSSLARALVALGEGARALALVEEALGLLEDDSDKVVRALAQLSLAQAQWATGARDAALAAAAKAHAGSSEEDVFTRTRVEALLAQAKR